MDSQQQTQRSGSQAQTGLEQIQEYVSLRDLEFIPSAKQPIFTSCSFAIPQFTSTAANTNSVGQGTKVVNKPTQGNTNSSLASTVSRPGGVSLAKLWEEPGVDLNEVTPTAEEREEYQQKRDGLAQMATGPTCSVCGEPLTFEVLAKGTSCNVCGFM